MVVANFFRRVGTAQPIRQLVVTRSAVSSNQRHFAFQNSSRQGRRRFFCQSTRSSDGGSTGSSSGVLGGSSRGSNFDFSDAGAGASSRVEAGSCTKQLSRYQILIKQYGKVAIVTHVVISTGILAGVYFALDRGVDVAGLVRQAGCDSLADSTAKIMGSSLGTFGVAFGIYKSLAPIRWPITIFTVPFVARGLKRIRL